MDEQKLTVNPAYVVCTECSGVMRYRGSGCYVCEECGHEELDDFGKIRRFLEKRGPSNAFEIALGTGVDRSVVTGFLRDGRLEVAPNLTGDLYCARCGMPIRFGEYCAKCQSAAGELRERNIKKGIYNSLKDEQAAADDKMRFIHVNKK